MSVIFLFAGASSTKGHSLARFLKILSAIDVMLVQIWDVKDEAKNASNATDRSTNVETGRRLTHLLVAARSCFQRLSIAVRGYSSNCFQFFNLFQYFSHFHHRFPPAHNFFADVARKFGFGD